MVKKFMTEVSFASSLNAQLSLLFLTRNVQNLADLRQLDYLMVLVGPVLIDKCMFNIWTSANMGMWQKMVVKQIDSNFPLDVKGRLLFILFCFVCHKLYKAKKSNYLNSHGEEAQEKPPGL